MVEQFGKSRWCCANGTFRRRPGPDPGQDRGLRRVPHRPPRRERRLAGQADAAVHPGHEGIGRVSALGAGVTIVKEGDRVGVPWLHSACGHCEYCLTAWETICAGGDLHGYTTRMARFAEYLLADPNYVAHIPAGLSAQEAAPLICAGITSYKGIKETEAKPGRMAGRLGHRRLGAPGHPICEAHGPESLRGRHRRRQAGAGEKAWARMPRSMPRLAIPAAAVKKATDGGAHGVLITAPSLERVQAGRRHDAQARDLRAGRHTARAISRSRCSMWWPTASASAAPSSATARTWPKP
jgi:hypothetical protein